MNDNSEFKILSKAKYLISYSDEYILSSFPKVYISLKIKFEDNLYDLISNIYKANINRGNIRIKYIKDILININLLDFFIGRIKDKKIIKTNRYSAFLNAINELYKMVNGWLNYEENK